MSLTASHRRFYYQRSRAQLASFFPISKCASVPPKWLRFVDPGLGSFCLRVHRPPEKTTKFPNEVNPTSDNSDTGHRHSPVRLLVIFLVAIIPALAQAPDQVLIVVN